MVKHPLSGGDHARDHESGSVKHRKAQNPSLDSSHDAEPVVMMDLRQVQFPLRASVVSEMISVHQNLRVIAIMIAIEQRRAEIRAAHQQIAVVQLRLLTYSDRRCDENCRRAFVASNNRSVHHLVHAVVIGIAYHWDGADERLAYQ